MYVIIVLFVGITYALLSMHEDETDHGKEDQHQGSERADRTWLHSRHSVIGVNMTIKAVSSHKYAELRSKKYRVIIMPLKGHMHVQVYGPGFVRKGLSSVKDSLTAFELKATALYYYGLARKQGKAIDVKNVNYAEIFGSCFE